MPRRIRGQLVIATHNPGKLTEMRELLSPHGVTAISAADLGLAEPEETGNSFAAPHIAGLITRILSKHPGMTPFQMKTVLSALADNVRA